MKYENKKAIDRINIIKGQLDGVSKMIENKKEHDNIMIQLKAIASSVNSLSNYVLESYLNDYMSTKYSAHELDEIINLFKKFNN